MEAFIRNGQIDKIASHLSKHPEAVNELINWGPKGKNRSHPLHFVCDAVFERNIEETTGLDIANVLFDKGALVDGQLLEGKDTPLIAACSLYTDQLGLLYLSKLPYLEHKGVHGGTALHWAAYTGSSVMAKALLEAGASFDRTDNEFASSPLGWAIHAVQNASNVQNQRDQLGCIRLLAKAGADVSSIQIDSQKWPHLAEALGFS